MRSSGLPPLYSGSLPPTRNPKDQPVLSEKRGAGGLSGVGGLVVHHERGADLGRICVWPPSWGKEGERVKGPFQPLSSRVSEPSNQL